MDNREKALSFIRMNGPVIPSKVAKYIEKDIIITSAMLSELSSNGQLKISSLKVGSSPLYYVQGQEEKLQNFSGNLNQKDVRTYNLLKEKEVLRDTAQDPLVRVSLRQIKDFAVPLEVNVNGSKELFWKWYLLGNDRVTELIKKELGINDEDKKISQPKPAEKPEPVKEGIPPKLEPEKKDQTEQQKVQEDARKESQEPAKKETITRPKEEQQKKITEDTEDKAAIKDEFAKEVDDFFLKSQIHRIDHQVIKKGKETDFIVDVKSPVGEITYYCKAINKKRVNESDLSLVYAQGQIKKLPALLVTPGQLTKKAEKMLESAEFKQLKVMKL